VYPILLELNGLTLRSYTLMAVLAAFGSLAVVRLEVKRMGWPSGLAWRLVLGSTLIGWLGAHLLFAVTRLGVPWHKWWAILLNVGYGGVWFGGVLAGWAFIHFYSAKKGIPRWQVYDLGAFAILIAQPIGRLGCLLGGCCYGSPTTLPWGVWVENKSYLDHSLHPTPLYEALFQLCVFAWLWSRRKQNAVDGLTAARYLVVVPIGRFVVEFFRGDDIRGFVVGWLSTSQFISLFLCGIGLAMLANRSRVGRARPAHLGPSPSPPSSSPAPRVTA